jgi:hypothetical protein
MPTTTRNPPKPPAWPPPPRGLKFFGNVAIRRVEVFSLQSGTTRVYAFEFMREQRVNGRVITRLTRVTEIGDASRSVRPLGPPVAPTGEAGPGGPQESA